MTTRRRGRLAALTVAATLGLTGLAAPAVADPSGPDLDDIYTSRVHWADPDHHGMVSSRGALNGGTQHYYSDDEPGWTLGPLDDFGTLTYWVNGNDGMVTFSGGPDATVVQGGVTTLTYSWMASDADLGLNLTLTLSGSFVRWDYEFFGGDAGSTAWYFDGGLVAYGPLDIERSASGASPTWVVAGQSEMGPAVTAHHYTTDSMDHTWSEQAGDVRVILDAPTEFTYTLAVLDYSFCGPEDAADAALEMAPTLDEHFGDALDTFMGDCLAAEDIEGTVGTPLDVRVPVTVTTEGWLATMWGEFSAMFLSDLMPEFSPEVEGLPDWAEHEFLLENDTLVLHVWGTPTATAQLTPVLWLTMSNSSWVTSPVMSVPFALTIEGADGGSGGGDSGGSNGGQGGSGSQGGGSQTGSAASTAARSGTKLASTGTDALAPVGLAGLLLAAGGALVLARRHRSAR